MGLSPIVGNAVARIVTLPATRNKPVIKGIPTVIPLIAGLLPAVVRYPLMGYQRQTHPKHQGQHNSDNEDSGSYHLTSPLPLHHSPSPPGHTTYAVRDSAVP